MSTKNRLDKLEQRAAARRARSRAPLDNETRARRINDLLAGHVDGDPGDVKRRQELVRAILAGALERTAR